MLELVREAAALLLGRFATVLVLVFLEGQQIGLLLLQLPLELLGLALLLQLPPLILLSVGRIKLNQSKPGRVTWKRFIFTSPAEAGSRLEGCSPALWISRSFVILIWVNHQNKFIMNVFFGGLITIAGSEGLVRVLKVKMCHILLLCEYPA